MTALVASYALMFARMWLLKCGNEVSMAERTLMKGNEALAEGTIRAGCRFFAGYPITPQNEVPDCQDSNHDIFRDIHAHAF